MKEVQRVQPARDLSGTLVRDLEIISLWLWHKASGALIVQLLLSLTQLALYPR